MKILVLQHARIETPGYFSTLLEEDGHEYFTIELDEGESLPSIEEIDNYDGLWVMGGPMDVWQEDEYPWLKDEKEFIRHAVEEKGLPYLGFCLGHQLLAEALGGKCRASATPEIGVMDVQLTEEGAVTTLFDGLPESFPSLQWHSAEITQMPAGGKCLATSPDCAVQAMSWGPRAHSMQFHIEIESNAAQAWNAIPEYADALEKAMGSDGVTNLAKDVDANLAGFKEMAERIYINWLQTCARVI